MRSEPIEIEIDLSSTTWNARAPGARVYIDQQLIFDASVLEPVTVRWNGDLPPGDHKLVVEMHGKLLEDTQETEDKTAIVNDMLLHIQQIRFDAIDSGIIPWRAGVFQADPANPYAPTEPVKHCVDIGWNGTWEMPFETPLYIWLLENIS